MLGRVTIAAIALVRYAHCRKDEGADGCFALVNKYYINKRKKELRLFAPGCLGKE
jgi:hypothetical protein